MKKSWGLSHRYVSAKCFSAVYRHIQAQIPRKGPRCLPRQTLYVVLRYWLVMLNLMFDPCTFYGCTTKVQIVTPADRHHGYRRSRSSKVLTLLRCVSCNFQEAGERTNTRAFRDWISPAILLRHMYRRMVLSLYVLILVNCTHNDLLKSTRLKVFSNSHLSTQEHVEILHARLITVLSERIVPVEW